MDVVQAVWADVLTGFRTSGWHFADRRPTQSVSDDPRPHRLIDRRRHYRRAWNANDRSATSSRTTCPARPAPAQRDVHGQELWERDARRIAPPRIAICSPEARGTSPGRDRRSTGLHEGSIRRILYNVARRLTRPDEAGTPP